MKENHKGHGNVVKQSFLGVSKARVQVLWSKSGGGKKNLYIIVSVVQKHELYHLYNTL